MLTTPKLSSPLCFNAGSHPLRHHEQRKSKHDATPTEPRRRQRTPGPQGADFRLCRFQMASSGSSRLDMMTTPTFCFMVGGNTSQEASFSAYLLHGTLDISAKPQETRNRREATPCTSPVPEGPHFPDQPLRVRRQSISRDCVVPRRVSLQLITSRKFWPGTHS